MSCAYAIFCVDKYSMECSLLLLTFHNITHSRLLIIRKEKNNANMDMCDGTLLQRQLSLRNFLFQSQCLHGRGFFENCEYSCSSFKLDSVRKCHPKSPFESCGVLPIIEYFYRKKNIKEFPQKQWVIKQQHSRSNSWTIIK